MRVLLFLLLAPAVALSGLTATSPAVVVLPEQPVPAEVKAAEELAHYWEKITHGPVEVRREPERLPVRPRYHRFGASRPASVMDKAGFSFFVGETRGARLHAPLPADLDRDGFALRRSGDSLFLRGGSPAGTRFAVNRFLHDYGQVRWYMPTELGEHVPEFSLEELPPIDRVESPDFLSRQLSGIGRFTEDDWGGRNSLERRYRFHHNLHRVFTEALYDPRPDFFIMLGGERIRPDDTLGAHNHQICFGNPDTAKFAARKAAGFFDENPSEISFSLGMNDTDAICECPDCQRWVDPDKTFRDRPDYSDLVFTFMNRAAEELGKTHPDKYLGCLAYYWAENVPSFPVHPKVIPYLTADRPQWHNEAFRREDRELMARWTRAGPERIGMYDYYYGSSFVIPRVFTAITEDSIRYAREAGIDGFYAEVAPIWSLDGPKSWLTAQLLWDASQDRAALLEQYYRDFFGESAGPMRRFFERCEEIWMNQGEPVFWLKFFHDFTQLELFPPEVCAELRELLRDAGERAASDLARARVALVSEGFGLTERYSRLYHGIKDAAGAAEELDRDGLVAALKAAIDHRNALEEHYENAILPGALHRPSRRFEERARFLPGAKLARLLERAAALSRHNEERDELARIAEDLSAAFPESRAATAVEKVAAGWREILSNGDFEKDVAWTGAREALLDDADYTPFFWKRDREEVAPPAFALTDAESREGEFSVSARGAVRDVLFQRFSATPGEVFRFSVWAKGRVSPGSRVEVQLSWRGAGGGTIKEEFLGLDQLLPGQIENWQKLMVLVPAPPGTVHGHASLTVRDQAPGDVVYFDGASLRLVEP